MSFTYGFYNSKNGDRKYNARQMALMFDALITNGVMSHIGDRFDTKPQSGMSVTVGTGFAWYNHTWSYNDSEMIMTAEQSDVLLDRIDALVLEIDETETVRKNAIKWITGTPATNPAKPALINNHYLHQYPLKYITIPANSTMITAANIENCVGTSACPYATGILTGTDIDDLVAQWDSQFDVWFDSIREVFGQIQVDENGIYEYVHDANGLTGVGVNGKFKCVSGGSVESIKVNGTSYAVRCGEDTEIDLVEGTWYTFVLDNGDHTVNFKSGGASLNFKMVSGTTYPKSTSKNLIVYPYFHTTMDFSGVILTDNGDGSITANGTATAEVVFRLAGVSVNDLARQRILPAGTYTLAGCPAGGSNDTYRLELLRDSDGAVLATNAGTPVTFTVSEETRVRFNIVVRNGITMTNLVFYPRLVEGNVDPGFVRYSYKENAIWVNTDSEITGWTFDAKEPTYQLLDNVWFELSTASNAIFNALKKNYIMLYPKTCKQWNGSQWVTKEAYIYKNNEWTKLIRSPLYIFNQGGSDTDFQPYSIGGYYYNYQRELDGITCWRLTPHDSKNYTTAIRSYDMIELDGYSTLKASIRAEKGYGQANAAMPNISLFVSDVESQNLNTSHTDYSTVIASKIKCMEFDDWTEISLDISDIKGSHYVGIGVGNKVAGASSTWVKELWLE